ncbi:MAG: hypothetical protein R8P61_33760 [Bacteroidia bacterium]|nr:hypothetical protein [Bacteroidia bacterium]
MKETSWKNYGLEFLSIFIAVISAFALTNWQENQREREAELKILTEIQHGLEKDIEDVLLNIKGHEAGLKACSYWARLVNGQETSTDTLREYYLDLTRDFISIQNVSGYETLKSRGLELIEDDSLRFDIISLYEYDYEILLKFEEEYQEMQFQRSYYHELNDIIAPNLLFDERGDIADIELPLKISSKEKKLFLSYLWKININRNFILRYYKALKGKLEKLQTKIDSHLAS